MNNHSSTKTWFKYLILLSFSVLALESSWALYPRPESANKYTCEMRIYLEKTWIQGVHKPNPEAELLCVDNTQLTRNYSTMNLKLRTPEGDWTTRIIQKLSPDLGRVSLLIKSFEMDDLTILDQQWDLQWNVLDNKDSKIKVTILNNGKTLFVTEAKMPAHGYHQINWNSIKRDLSQFKIQHYEAGFSPVSTSKLLGF